MKTSNILLTFLCLLLFALTTNAQEKVILTYDQAVSIALKESYTIKSNDESRQAMQYEYLYYKAQFKPRLDINLYVPSWDESVQTVARPDGLPAYNSNSSMLFGGNMSFTYVLPTGGNLALAGRMNHQNNKTTYLKGGIWETDKEQIAYSRFGVEFNQPIFTKNTLRENLKAAEYKYQRSESYFTRAQMDIVYNVTQGFYELYYADYERTINEERLKNSKEALRIAKLKLETGNLPEGDVLITEVSVAQNDARLSESVGKYEREKDNFKLLIGLDITSEIDILAETDFEPIIIDLETAIEQALKNRMEITENQYNIELQKIEIDKAKREREFKGNISAYYDFTGVGTNGSSVNQLFESSFDNLTVRPPNRGITFTLSYPIYDWGRGKNIVKRERIRLKAQELELDNTQKTIVKQVRDVVRTVYEAESRFRINQKNKDNANRSYRINQLRFENGDITGQELATEQERLSQVQLDYINSYITYQLALADLKRKTMWDFENNRSYIIENETSK